VQRPGDGRGRHRKDVNIDAHSFELFLVLDAEPLLLVNYQKPEVLESHVAAQKPMGTDEHIDPSCSGPRDYVFGLLRRPKAIENLDRDGEIGKALSERPAVLHAQDRSGHEDRHLFAALDRLECRPHGQFGFAVSHVTTEQSVHCDGLAHVGLYVLDGGGLVGRFLIRKRFFEFHLPVGILGEGYAAYVLTRSLDLEQLTGEVLDRACDLLLLSLPPFRADLAERRPLRAGTDILLQKRDVADRYLQPGCVGVLNGQVLALAGSFLYRLDTQELADAVRDVDDVVARLQVTECLDG
jgi:hypothetical protein